MENTMLTNLLNERAFPAPWNFLKEYEWDEMMKYENWDLK